MNTTNQQPIQIIEQHVKDIFMRGKSEIDLTADTPLVQSGILDSLGLFKLVSFLEEQFKIKIASNEINLANFETVAAMEKLVLSKQKTV